MATITRTPRLIYSCWSPQRATGGIRRLSSQTTNRFHLAPQHPVSTISHARNCAQQSGSGSRTPIRSFTASHIKPTRAIINPRKDEKGDDMIIDIMPRAANRLQSISKTDNNPNLCLRVSVESGGCHGFQYLMSLTDMEKIDKEEDTVFETEDGKSAKVVIDEPSLDLLKGSKIDYTMELIGSQFKVTGIPGATSSCGCGSSFDVQA